MRVSPAIVLSESLHRQSCRVLRIKSSPPTYRRYVTEMADLFAGSFDQAVQPHFQTAVSELQDAIEAGKTSDADMNRILGRLDTRLQAAGVEVTQNMAQQLGTALTGLYGLGLSEVSTPLGLEAVFDLVDQDVIHGLRDAGLFWIGEHYGDVLPMKAMKGVIREIVAEQGLGYAEAGKRLRSLFGGVIERQDSYWTGLAATMATRARSFGALSGMESAGVTRYEYINPDDERTSPVCKALNGKVFGIKGALKLRNRLLKANTPEKWKKIAPWPRKVEELQDSNGKMLTGSKLHAKGIAWPPLHFHCRSGIIVKAWGRWPPDPDVPDRPRAPPPPPPIDWSKATQLTAYAVEGLDPDGSASVFQAFGGKWDTQIQQVPVEELRAVKSYTGSSYTTMNEYLRDPALARKAIERGSLRNIDRVRQAQAALRRTTVPEDVIAWRGVKSTMDPIVKAYQQGKLKPGFVPPAQDDAFQSVSMKLGVARRFAGSKGYDKVPLHLQVRIPKGTRGMWVATRDVKNSQGLAKRPEAVSSHAGEQEIVLPPGTRYRVVSVDDLGHRDTAGEPVPVVTVDVLADDLDLDELWSPEP